MQTDTENQVHHAIELLVEHEAGEEHSHYDRSNFLFVEAGQPIAKLAADAEHLIGLSLKNVNRTPEGMFVATVAGCLKADHAHLWVEPGLRVAGNVDFSSGNVEYKGDVCVIGNVVDLFKVNATGAVTIAGTIEAAEVSAGTDLTAKGGIAGREKGICRANGKLTAKYISGATVEVGGDVQVLDEVSHARLVCGGRLKVTHRTIVASHITANGGVECANLGAPGAGAKTIIEVGVDAQVRKLAQVTFPAVQRMRHKAAQVRLSIEPLMRDQKKLTVAQRERATELLYQADEIEQEANDKDKALRDAFERAQAKRSTEIVVGGKLFAGTIVRLGELEQTIDNTADGPLTITLRDHEGTQQIALVQTHGGSTRFIGGRPVRDPEMDAMRQQFSKAA
ncbi:MAG TPA: FapA family protein [Tepidisphaeraceae bacterium]|nr:FapA family protein [Tepidisphaeraceae bacterium]